MDVGAAAASGCADPAGRKRAVRPHAGACADAARPGSGRGHGWGGRRRALRHRSEEHTSELQSLMRSSYAVFCLKKKTSNQTQQDTNYRSNAKTSEIQFYIHKSTD